MSSNIKKGLILCDYCQIEKDGKQIYTSRMQFAGCKIVDILQIIVHRKIPLSAPIKLCGLCASTLHAATGAIEKSEHMISKLLGTNNNETVENQKETHPSNVECEEDEVEETQAKPSKAKITTLKTAQITNGTPTAAQQSPKKQPTKAKEVQPSTPLNALSSLPKQPKSIKDQRVISVSKTKGTPTESPKKQPKELQNSFKDNLDDSLKDVIKLTPVKDVSKKSKALIQLFGNSVNHISESEEGSEDDDDIIDIPDVKSIGFECKLCDYKTTNPTQFKRHLRENHGQKRPRIFNCTQCPKSFGVIKSLRTHQLTHGMVEDKDDEEPQAKSGDPQLAVLTALTKTTKPKPLLNAEYTFAIQDTNSSTPKPNEDQQKAQQPQQQIQQTYQCEICQLEMKTVKSIQEHMKTIHNIEKPKIFKCDACDATFMHKTTKDRHFMKKHSDDQDLGKTTKTPVRRETIDVRPSKADKEQKPVKKPLVRRKTVDVRIVEEPQAKIKKKLEIIVGTPTKESIQEDADTPSQLNNLPMSSESPTKKKSKENKKEDPVSLLKEVFKTSESPSQKKSKEIKEKHAENTLIQLDDSAIEESVTETPSKKSKSKKGTDVLDTTQTTPVTPMSNGTPKKSHKRKSDKLAELSSQVDPDEHAEIQQSPLKKSKLDKKKNSESEIIELLDEVNTNPMPHKREMLESQDISESQLSCSQCSKVVSSRKRLDSHIKKKHTPVLNCHKCENNFYDSLEFISHFVNCDASDGLPCGVKNCDKIFEAANFLSSHLKKKHKFN